jgi:hypothetical protein
MVTSGVGIYLLHIQERGKALAVNEEPCQVREDLACFWLIIVQDSDKLNELATVNLP